MGVTKLKLAAVLAAALAAAPAAQAAIGLDLPASVTAALPGATASDVANLVAANDAELAPSIIAEAIAAGLSAEDILAALLTREPQQGDVTEISLRDAVAWVVEAAPDQSGEIVFQAASTRGLPLGGAELNELADIAVPAIASIEARLGRASEETRVQVAAVAAELLPFVPVNQEEAFLQIIVDATSAEDTTESLAQDIVTQDIGGSRGLIQRTDSITRSTASD